MKRMLQTEKRLKEHVETIASSIGPRSIYKPESLQKAALYIENNLKEMGYDPMSQSYTVWTKEVRNIIVYLNGAPDRPYYLLGAHYDSVSHTPGADDNASAVAVLLEVARLVAEKKSTIKQALCFVFFTLEEPPTFGTSLMGSRVFVSKAKTEAHSIKGALILEMVGYYCSEPGSQKYPPFLRSLMGYPKVGDFIGVIGDAKSKGLVKKIMEAFKKNPSLPSYSLVVPLRGYLLPASRLSDNASFWDRGIPAVMITDTAYYRNPNYHSASDTPETLDYSMMAQLVKSIMLFLEAVEQV